jgi:hypothetical protein
MVPNSNEHDGSAAQGDARGAAPDDDAVLPPFDFGSYNAQTAIMESVSKIREDHAEAGLPDGEAVCPQGMSRTELDEMEDNLGTKLPAAYQEIILAHRYVAVDDGAVIFGMDPSGLYGPPWLSDEHEPGRSWLVIGRYWMYADGDDLLMDPGSGEVYVYLHEYEGRIEGFAGDAKEALYRLAFEA